MAKDDKYKISVTIGAALSSGFGSAMSGSVTQIKKVGSAIQAMEKDAKDAGKSVDKLKVRYNSLVASVGKQHAILAKRNVYKSRMMGIVALGASLVAPVKAAMDFEKSLAELKSVARIESLGTESSKELEKFGEVINDLSLKIPVAASELISLATVGSRFGVAYGDLANFTETVAKASKVWGMGADEAGEKVGNLMKTFKITASELPKHFDTLSHLGNVTGATAGKIMSSLTKSGFGLAEFKLSLPQAAALNSTLISMGYSAEQVGTQVGAFLQKLAAAPNLGENAQKALRSIGISAKVLPKEIELNPQKTLDKLLSSFAKVPESKRAALLQTIFGAGTGQIVTNLLDKMDLYRKNLNYASDPAVGAMGKDYANVLITTESSITLLKNSVLAIVRTLGATLLPTINSVIKAISSALVKVNEFMKENKEFVVSLMKVVSGFATLKIGLFALGFAWTFVAGVLNKVVIAFKTIRLALALTGLSFRSFFRIGPLALIGITYAIISNWDKVKEFFAGFWSKIEPHWQRFKAILGEFAITKHIIAGWNMLKGVAVSVCDSVTKTISAHWSNFSSVFDKYGITDKVLSIGRAIKSIFTEISDFVGGHINDFISLLDKGCSAAIEMTVSAARSIKDFFVGLGESISSVWDGFLSYITGIADKIMAKWKQLQQFFRGLWKSILPSWEWFSGSLSKVWNGAGSLASNIGKLFRSDASKSVGSQVQLSSRKPDAITNRNQNNQFTINVHAMRAKDSEEVAEMVMEKMQRYTGAFLYDEIGMLP